jgi:hypothetical protein
MAQSAAVARNIALATRAHTHTRVAAVAVANANAASRARRTAPAPPTPSRPCRRGVRGVALSAVQDQAEAGAADEEQQETVGDIEVPEAPKHIRILDGFLPSADAAGLRATFDERHADPRRVHEYRFVWDYWHVPDQYTLLRTPAADYFPKPQFDQLVGRDR